MVAKKVRIKLVTNAQNRGRKMVYWGRARLLAVFLVLFALLYTTTDVRAESVRLSGRVEMKYNKGNCRLFKKDRQVRSVRFQVDGQRGHKVQHRRDPR